MKALAYAEGSELSAAAKVSSKLIMKAHCARLSLELIGCDMKM